MQRRESRALDRRSFLTSAAGLAAAAVVTPERILADPYAPLVKTFRSRDPVRIRGRVMASGRGLPVWESRTDGAWSGRGVTVGSSS